MSTVLGACHALEVTDGIDRKTNAPDPGLIYENSNEFEHYGIELDFQKSTKRAILFSNFSYLHEANSVSSSDTSQALSPEYIFAFGGNYTVSQSQQIGLSYEYKSERKVASGEKSLKASHLVNINYQYQHDNLQFFVTLNNILESEIREPDVNKTDFTLQAKPDTISVITGIKATF